MYKIFGKGNKKIFIIKKIKKISPYKGSIFNINNKKTHCFSKKDNKSDMNTDNTFSQY
jgi:hypothetical protein